MASDAPGSPSPEVQAENDPRRKVSRPCQTIIGDDAAQYRLYFTELDDRGWLHRAGARYGGASSQCDTFVRDLREVITQGDESISVVVFVYGWKHTARSEDKNVKRFRSLLDCLPRRFCSVDVLNLETSPRFGPGGVNSPVWNIQTSAPIIDYHDGSSNPRVIAFFRQCY